MEKNLINTTPLAYPAISIVIPMYNTEKYVGACLTSILNQTFQNFEVIVVDDCSTDKSCEVVENFIPKFGGRLKFLHMKKNSGGPGEPSNKGVYFSRGKYIYLIDNDDLIVNNALEILLKYAEKFKVDVVGMKHSFEFFRNSENPFPSMNDIRIATWYNRNLPNELTFESDDISERILKFSRDDFGRTAWQRLVRRDLLIENEIIFPNTCGGQDIIWVMQVILFAKKILTIPDVVYFWRYNMNSISRSNKNKEKRINIWINNLVEGIGFMLNFFDNHKIFKENPLYQWNLLDYWVKMHFTSKFIVDMPYNEVYEILKDILTKKFGDYGNLIAYLCQSSNLLMYRLISAEQRAEKLEKQLRELQVKL